MRKRSKKLVLAGVLTAALAMSSAVPALAAEGWQQNQTGWWYEYNDGSYVTASWKMVNGTWYYFNTDGYMSTGWIQENGKWFFADSTGAMQSGWVAVDNVYYYLNPVSDGTKGMMKMGDVTIDGKIFHFTESGACTNPEPTPGMKRFTKAGFKVERSSGGGSGTTESVAEKTEKKVVEAANKAIEAAKASGVVGDKAAIKEIVVDESKNEINIALNSDKDAKIADIENVFKEPVKAMMADENVTEINYNGKAYTKELAEKYIEDVIKDQADRKLSELKDSYTVTATLKNGDTVEYNFNVSK